MYKNKSFSTQLSLSVLFKLGSDSDLFNDSSTIFSGGKPFSESSLLISGKLLVTSSPAASIFMSSPSTFNSSSFKVAFWRSTLLLAKIAAEPMANKKNIQDES